MNPEYINHKLRDIYELRSSILKEMGKSEEIQLTNSDSFIKTKFKRNFKKQREIRIACIMDEFTYNSFQPECELFAVSPSKWLSEMEEFKPDLFFLESAWRGIEGQWNTKVSSFSDELVDLLNYCREKAIPTVFWNKEDPVHFDTFLAVAQNVNIVFTTDIDCIPDYREMLKHDRVYFMPFGAQTRYHNPIETYPRADSICFAGAYYKRYPERVRDLEEFINELEPIIKVDIYDRNYNGKDPNYAFPKRYRDLIVGSLSPTDIDKAYKGYRFNLNMNSVKQSQSMCARRVFELLASNTVTLSNYSRAVRNLFGDLVVCSDHPKKIRNELNKFIADPEYYNKFRLVGLRKVMAEHTMRDRLALIIENVFESSVEDQGNKVAVFAYAKTTEDIACLIKQFRRQLYQKKHLYIYTTTPHEYDLPDDVSLVNELSNGLVEHIREMYQFWAFFSNVDYYGKNYIVDYELTLRYAANPILCKGHYFEYNDGEFRKIGEGISYTHVERARLRRAFIDSYYIDSSKLIGFIQSIEHGEVEGPCLSIDEYNYCMGFGGERCPIVDDISSVDPGLEMRKFHDLYRESRALRLKNEVCLEIEPKSLLTTSNNTKFRSYMNDSDLVIESTASSEEYLFFNNALDVGAISAVDLCIELDVEYVTPITSDLVVLMFDKKKRLIGRTTGPLNQRLIVAVPEGTKWIELGVSTLSEGSFKIRKVNIMNYKKESNFLLKSDVILITDKYPSYESYYQNAFVHSRVVEYKNQGLLTDIFVCNDFVSVDKAYSEFEGIDITSGYYDEINNILMHGDHKTVLIHYLTVEMWKGIRNSVRGKRIFIWVHGAEIQPWWRRSHNFRSKSELDSAKIDSDLRIRFWKEIFQVARNKEYDIHFIFVSEYLATSVFEDLEEIVPHSDYSIIHNYINTELFRFEEKGENQRKKVLSIRPFTSHNYANDLTTKAILSLSRDPIFKELEFKIVGRGELFKSTLKPLRKFKNVIIEEGFLSRAEVAALHRDYGVFLVPTRIDTQGVSRDEAMSSGLVPITNKVAAIPEFVDENSGMLAEKEDYRSISECIKQLFNNPDLFKKLSNNAAKRVRSQSGFKNTISREIGLIEGGLKKEESQ